MINSKNITPEQTELLRQWAAEGLDLNQIQKKINQEFGISITYLDTRFLLMDLDIQIIQPKKEEESPANATDTPLGNTSPSLPGSTSVTIDEITPPHALLTGKVTFKSGHTGTWSIDKMGRIDWAPISGEPTDDDLQAFQTELQKVLRQQMGGF